MSDEALLELVFHGREERNLEYKTSMSWRDTATKAKIAKASMAMANLRDGGAIVLGVDKVGEQYVPTGMKCDHMDTFKQDDVMEHVNRYADPYVQLKVSFVSNDDKWFVVIQIEEFEQVPVVCKKEGIEELRRGAVFTRSRAKHETSQVRSQAEMREILDLAVDKEMRRLRTRCGAISPVGPPEETDRERFEEQLGNL